VTSSFDRELMRPGMRRPRVTVSSLALAALALFVQLPSWHPDKSQQGLLLASAAEGDSALGGERIYMNGRRVDERAAQVAQAVQKIHQQMESGELSADRGEELLGRLGQRRETVLEKSKEKLSNMLKSGAVSQEKAKELFKRMKELDEENEAVGKGGRGKSTGYGTYFPTAR